MDVGDIRKNIKGKVANLMSKMGLDLDKTMNEIIKFAKGRPVPFIVMVSIGASSSIPIGTFLLFMVFGLATAFISFFVVAASLLGFGAVMLAVALVVVACMAVPPTLMLVSFYLGSTAIMKLTSSCWPTLQRSPGSKNVELVPLFSGQGGSNKTQQPDYVTTAEDSQPSSPESQRS